MATPWPMPCHTTRLLATPALMTAADTALTPSEPTTGSYWPPSSNALTLRLFGSGGALPLGQFRHLTRFIAPTAPNSGYSLPHATTSSRTRSGVGRLSESLQLLTNCPSVWRSDSAWLIRLFSWLASPDRADARAPASALVLDTRSPWGKASAVLIASATAATDAPPGPWPARASASIASIAPFG